MQELISSGILISLRLPGSKHTCLVKHFCILVHSVFISSYPTTRHEGNNSITQRALIKQILLSQYNESLLNVSVGSITRLRCENITFFCCRLPTQRREGGSAVDVWRESSSDDIHVEVKYAIYYIMPPQVKVY